MTVKEVLEKRNIIYKSLAKIDKDCRDHFEGKDISNEEYFLYGIKLDLATNLMAIFLNDQICGIDSPGIELNARNVLEAIAILNCHEKGDLDQHNYDLYRDSFLPIEYSNESVVFKWLNTTHPEAKIVRERNDNLKAFYKKWADYYKCDTYEIQKYSRDSLFYLQKKLRSPVFPNDMVKKYVNLKYAEYHKFLGLVLHPSAFDEEIFDIVKSQRFDMIMSIYLFALDYLKDKKYLNDNDMPSFDECLKNGVIKGNLDLVDKEIKVLNRLNFDTTHYLDGSIDYFYWRTFCSLINLVRDVEVCTAFGYYEQAVLKFKIFAENIAVFSKVSGAPTKRDYLFMKRAFRISTTYQLDEFLKNQHIIHIDDTGLTDELLVDIYNDYFKEKNPNIKLNVFIDKIKHDSLFFIYLNPDEKKSYRRVVKDYTSNVLLNNAIGTNTYNLYQISLDIGHSCGYAFNASIRVWDRAPKEVSYLMFGYLGIHFEGGKEFFKDKKDQINFSDDALKYLTIFIEAKKKMLELEIQKEIEEQERLEKETK